jgi:3-hydroxyisobutyrate dehydrogenase-like beta-hydroxyacid dehydrogenase
VNSSRIAFLGTGIMGAHMARRLAEAGHSVTAWNRTRAKADRLAAAGVGVADTAIDAVADCEIAICMLIDGPTCDAVLIDGGVIAAMPAGGLLIVMSSIPVETARREAAHAAEHGIRYLDAPVSGGEPGAAAGSLTIMVGGEADDLATAADVLAPLGRVTLVGPAGSGQLAKLANQLIVGATIATVAEALLLAETGGADPAAVREALLGGFADSTILREHGRRMLERDFVPGGAARTQLKDMVTVSALAGRLGLDLPVSALAEQLFQDMVDHGRGDVDHSGLYLELRRRNGLGDG